MKKEIDGTPFILDAFYIKNNSFLNQYVDSQFSTKLISNGNGQAVRINKSSAIKAAIGEHIERFSSMIHYSKSPWENNKPVLDCFNLLTGEVGKVDAYKVLMNYYLPIFKSIEDINAYYTDSCGLASHIYSEDVIINGFKEFIERQSLIYNWLSRSSGEKVDYNFITEEFRINKELLYLIKNVKSLSDEFFSFNISIVEEVYVILTIGYKGSAFSTGLGADFNFFKALQSSLNEYIMILESSIYLKFNSQSLDVSKDGKYVANFYNMDIKMFMKKYHYLLNSFKMIGNYSRPNINFNEILTGINKKLNLNICASFLPFPQSHINVKIVKIFSPEAYPHMDTELFNPEEFEISHYLPKTNFPNKYIPIPFA